jgi:hypothetical protein
MDFEKILDRVAKDAMTYGTGAVYISPQQFIKKTYNPIITEHFLDCASKVFQLINLKMTFEEYIDIHTEPIIF